jgi:carboxymethylenebutenolidase
VCETRDVSADPERDVALVSETVDVAAPDGVADAFLTRPVDGGRHPGVVLYTDAFGIRPAVEAHAERLAARGYCVLVPNVFYRDGRAPVLEDIERLMKSEDRSALFAALRPKMDALTPDAANRDSAAWLAHLRQCGGMHEGAVGVVGYCMGGRLSLRMAGEFPDAVAAAASFHGGNLATEREDSPHLSAVRAAAELYIGHADNDRSMDPPQMGRLTRALAEAHVRHTAELYVGAAHGWTQTDSPVYDEASATRHWARLLELFGRALRRDG